LEVTEEEEKKQRTKNSLERDHRLAGIRNQISLRKRIRLGGGAHIGLGEERDPL